MPTAAPPDEKSVELKEPLPLGGAVGAAPSFGSFVQCATVPRFFIAGTSGAYGPGSVLVTTLPWQFDSTTWFATASAFWVSAGESVPSPTGFAAACPAVAR